MNNGGAIPQGHVHLSDLPSDWAYRRFGDVLDVQGGSQPPKSEFRYAPAPGYVQLLQIRDFGEKPVPTFVREDSISKRCTENDVLIARYGASLGRIVTGKQGAYNVALAKVIFDQEQFFHRYLFYLLQTPFFQTPIHMISRSAQNGFNKGDLSEIWLPVAPFHEQYRIVAEIEKQFTRLDAGMTSLKQIQLTLKRYRASVLKAACEGQLTATKAPLTLSPLRDLITGLGQGWSPKCELNRDPLPGEWAIIKTTAIQSMKYLDQESKPLPQTLRPRPSIEIKVGDFLMTRKGPRQRAGVACLVRTTRERLMVCDTVYRFRCQESRVNPSYLELALNSPQAVSEIDKRKSGINDSGVSLTHEKLGGVLLPIPTLDEQERIISEVERRLSVIEELEAVVAVNLKRAERLRQSILHHAFTGGLLKQNVNDRLTQDLSAATNSAVRI